MQRRQRVETSSNHNTEIPDGWPSSAALVMMSGVQKPMELLLFVATSCEAYQGHEPAMEISSYINLGVLKKRSGMLPLTNTGNP